MHSLLHCRSTKGRPQLSLRRFLVAFLGKHYISMGSAFIREVYCREEKQRMSLAPWLKCRGPRLRTPGIDCTSCKLQETENFCSLYCLQSHEICRVVWKGPFFCVQSSGHKTKLSYDQTQVTQPKFVLYDQTSDHDHVWKAPFKSMQAPKNAKKMISVFPTAVQIPGDVKSQCWLHNRSERFFSAL